MGRELRRWEEGGKGENEVGERERRGGRLVYMLSLICIRYFSKINFLKQKDTKITRH